MSGGARGKSRRSGTRTSTINATAAGEERALRHEVALDRATGEEYAAPALAELAGLSGDRVPGEAGGTGRTERHPRVRRVAELSSKGRLACPACGNRLRAVLGSERRWHFALAATADGCHHEPESVEHRETKLAVFEHLQGLIEGLPSGGGGWAAYCERALENGRRPDILLVHDSGARLAVEVQYADISQEALARRRSDYAALGVKDLWLLGHSRLGRSKDLLARTVARSADQRLLYVSGSRATEVLPSSPPREMGAPESGWDATGKRRTRKVDYSLKRLTVALDGAPAQPKVGEECRGFGTLITPADEVFHELSLRRALKDSEEAEVNGRSPGESRAGDARAEPAARRWARIRRLTQEHDRLVARYGGHEGTETPGGEAAGGGTAAKAGPTLGARPGGTRGSLGASRSNDALRGPGEKAKLAERVRAARQEDAAASGYDAESVVRELRLALGQERQEVQKGPARTGDRQGPRREGLSDEEPGDRYLHEVAALILEDTPADWPVYCAAVRWKLPLAGSMLAESFNAAARIGTPSGRPGNTSKAVTNKAVFSYPHDRTRAAWAAEAFKGRLRRLL